MPKHCQGISRRELLRTGALSAGATVLPGAPAAAAIRAPAPAGDDVGYLVFGASAEVATGRRLETLAAGTYLSGITNTTDPGSRQLLGRLLSAASRNEALLTGWSGGALGGLTAPISLDTAGAALDRYLEDPS